MIKRSNLSLLATCVSASILISIAAGKSSLLRRIKENRFDDLRPPVPTTAVDYGSIPMKLGDKIVMLQIWDT